MPGRAPTIKWLLFALCAIAIATPRVAAQDVLAIEGPHRLILGEEQEVPIRVRVPRGEEIDLYASVGSIVGVHENEGWIDAKYLPPRRGHPQVAMLVAVTNDWEEVAWLPILLSGAPTVQFTFERRSDVTVEVRGEEFGPVRTGRDGSGDVKIVVPPGVQAATAVGIDRMENRRTQSIELNPEPFQRAFALCPEEGNEVWVFTVGAHGERGPIAPLTIVSSTGERLTPQQRRPGVYQVAVQQGDPEGHEAVEVTAQIQGWNGPASRCSLITAPPSEIALHLSQSQHAAGNTSPVIATIESHYPEGRVPRGAAPALSVDFGELGPLRPMEAGRYQAEWRLPAAFSGKSSATVRVECGGALAAAQLELVGPPPPEAPLAFALQGGLISNLGKVTGPSVHARGAHRMVLTNTQVLSLGASIGGWFAASEEQVQGGAERVEVAVLSASLLAEVGYALWFDPLEFFVRARGGVVLAESEVTAESTGTATEVQATYAFGGALGLGPRLGPGLLFVEGGYLYAPLSGSARGNVAGFSLQLGYEVRL